MYVIKGSGLPVTLAVSAKHVTIDFYSIVLSASEILLVFQVRPFFKQQNNR